IREAFQRGKVEKLNQIVHPAVAKEFERFAKNASNEGYLIVVKEAALLLNYGRPAELDVVVIIKSDQEKRIKRVVKRDQTSEESVLERNSKQPDFNELTHLADHVIENNGTAEELQKEAESLFESLSE
ncbi:MAG: dephospho-CoA kinase, partial [Balneolaceae bacterium]|nr:dephospho-CoA kinase [Balneolaceae bacterium]